MKRVSRRRWLVGAGTLFALPALEYFQAKPARSQGVTAPQRLLVYFVPNGRVPEWWVPAETGESFTLGPTSSALEPFKSEMIFLSGLLHTAGQNSSGAGDHARGTGSILTCKTMTDFTKLESNSISFDQALVQALAPPTRFPSVQWTAGEPGPCDFVSSCMFTQTLSWAGPGNPLSPIAAPLTAFNQLFAGTDEGATAEAQAVRRQSLQSVLDFAREDARDLEQALGAKDREKLEEYFTAVRELELRLTQGAAECDSGQAPAAELDYQARVAAFHELITLAFSCDLTRVATFMIEYGLSGRAHPFVDAPGGHHALSHDLSEQGRAELQRIESWECEQAAALAAKLKATSDVDGKSLFDNTVMLLISDMGLGANHDHTNVAPVLLGRGGGKLNVGRAANLAGAPLGDLYVTLLQAFGLQASAFGDDGSAALPGIVVA